MEKNKVAREKSVRFIFVTKIDELLQVCYTFYQKKIKKRSL